MTVESMLERSTGTLDDSIWAPHNRSRQTPQQRPDIPQARQPVRQPSSPTQFQKPKQPVGLIQVASPALQIGATQPAPWDDRLNGARGTKAPESTIVGQGNSSWETQPSQLGKPPSERYEADVC